MTESLTSYFTSITANKWPLPFLVLTDRSQKLHIADTQATTILSTHPDSAQLSSLSQALVTSNSAIEHLGLGRIRSLHAHYANGEVLQTVKLEGKTGLMATVAGKEVRRSTEIQKIVGVLHGALQGAEMEEDSREENESSEELNKSDERRTSEQWEVLGSG